MGEQGQLTEEEQAKVDSNIASYITRFIGKSAEDVVRLYAIIP